MYINHDGVMCTTSTKKCTDKYTNEWAWVKWVRSRGCSSIEKAKFAHVITYPVDFSMAIALAVMITDHVGISV